jgi:hypothetical protein
MSGTIDVAHIRQDDKVTHPSDHMTYSPPCSSDNEGELEILSESKELDIRPSPLKTVRDSLAMVLSDELAYVEECLSTQVSMSQRKNAMAFRSSTGWIWL